MLTYVPMYKCNKGKRKAEDEWREWEGSRRIGWEETESYSLIILRFLSCFGISALLWRNFMFCWYNCLFIGLLVASRCSLKYSLFFWRTELYILSISFSVLTCFDSSSRILFLFVSCMISLFSFSFSFFRFMVSWFNFLHICLYVVDDDVSCLYDSGELLLLQRVHWSLVILMSVSIPGQNMDDFDLFIIVLMSWWPECRPVKKEGLRGGGTNTRSL